MMNSEQLAEYIREEHTEREIHAVLKEYPHLVFSLFNPRGHTGFLVTEVNLGDVFRADFVTLQPFSYGWDVRLIELEPPNERLFTKSGKTASRLAGAVVQIDDWKMHIRNPVNEASFRQQLSKKTKDHDLIWSFNKEPLCTCGQPITDMGAWVTYHYHIVIGHSSTMSRDDLRRKSAFNENHNIDLLTYDRLADYVENAEMVDTHD